VATLGVLCLSLVIIGLDNTISERGAAKRW
jgi:hypothetical protein